MTRIGEMKLRCPCCRHRFMSRIWISTNTAGPLSTDFRQRAIGFQPLLLTIHTCPSCGYSGYKEDFRNRKVGKHLRSLIREKLTPLVKKEEISPGRKYEYAAWIAEWRGDLSRDIGELYLGAAWCCDCDDDGREEGERYYRQKTIEHFERALQRDEIPKDEVAEYNYLVGENFRRVGEKERAALWYNRAINAAGQDTKKKWLAVLAVQQKINPKDFIWGEEMIRITENKVGEVEDENDGIDDVDSFIEAHPTSFQREVIANFETMETDMVTIDLRPFAISKYPVANKQYYRFMKETKYQPQDPYEYSHKIFLSHWRLGKEKYPPPDKRLHPVTFVSYEDALTCAEFMGGRLPTYQEWLYAAFGNTKNRFPWGDIFSPDRCNVRGGNNMDTTPVGLYSPKGNSPIGCCDMVGNVWEWTSTPSGAEGEMFMAMGTGWDHYSFQTEIPLDRSYRNHSVGFRVVRDL